MEVDSESLDHNICIICPRCNEITIQKAGEYPIVCCNIPGMTFGSGRCCRCFTTINKDPEKIDLCLTCNLATMNIK